MSSVHRFGFVVGVLLLKKTRSRMNLYSGRFSFALEEVLGSFLVPKMYAKSIRERSLRHVQIPKRFWIDFALILDTIFGLPWWDPAKTFALDATSSCDAVLEVPGQVSGGDFGRILVA